MQSIVINLALDPMNLETEQLLSPSTQSLAITTQTLTLNLHADSRTLTIIPANLVKPVASTEMPMVISRSTLTTPTMIELASSETPMVESLSLLKMMTLTPPMMASMDIEEEMMPLAHKDRLERDTGQLSHSLSKIMTEKPLTIVMTLMVALTATPTLATPSTLMTLPMMDSSNSAKLLMKLKSQPSAINSSVVNPLPDLQDLPLHPVSTHTLTMEPVSATTLADLMPTVKTTDTDATECHSAESELTTTPVMLRSSLSSRVASEQASCKLG